MGLHKRFSLCCIKRLDYGTFATDYANGNWELVTRSYAWIHAAMQTDNPKNMLVQT